MGEPTEQLGGKHVLHWQNMPKNPSGHRKYKVQFFAAAEQDHLRMTNVGAGLSTSAEGQMSSAAGTSTPPPPPPPPPVRGVSVKRTKKKVRRLAPNGSPATQVASEEILTDPAKEDFCNGPYRGS